MSKEKQLQKALIGANSTFRASLGVCRYTGEKLDINDLNFACLNIKPKGLNNYLIQTEIEFDSVKCDLIVTHKGFEISGFRNTEKIVKRQGKTVPKELEKFVLKSFGFTFAEKK